MAARGTAVDVEDVIDLAQRAPAACVDACTSLLARDDVAADDRARVLWARGTARRETGDLVGSRADLELAWAHAVEHELAVEIAVTLSGVQLFLGDTAGAQATLDGVRPLAVTDRVAARLEMQVALVAHRLGELDRAAESYEAAVRLSRAAQDVDGEVRALSNLGLLRIYRNELAAAARSFERAVSLAAEGTIAHAAIEHNLGLLAERRGEPLEALRRYERAASSYERAALLGHMGHLESDRAELCLGLNLIEEACHHADEAVRLGREAGAGIDVAEALLVASRARLASGDRDAARAFADEAAASFAAHGRSRWVPLAAHAGLLARPVDAPDPSVAASARRLADALAENHWHHEAVQAYVVAGRLYLEAGDVETAAALLARTRSATRRGTASGRVLASEAIARLAVASGDTGAARRAVAAGLRTVQDNVAALGAVELRATMAAHARVLEDLGVRIELGARRARRLLRVMDDARTILTPVRLTTGPDDELAGLLTELRAVTSGAADDPTGTPDDVQRHRVAIESRIRSLVRQRASAGTVAAPSFTDAVGRLGEHVVIAYALVDGRYVAVSLDRGRARIHELAPAADVAACTDTLLFATHRLQRAQGSAASRAAALATLHEAGAELQRSLVPDRVAAGDRPVIVVPAPQLHGVSWRAMPCFHGRPFVVAASLRSWAAGADRRTERAERVALVGGPDLAHAASELAAIDAVHGRAHVLAPDAATVARALALIPTVDVLHAACHGTFRTDNPLFSTLRLADGDLTVYDLERCERLPATMILSACNAAQSALSRGGALLGMTTALLHAGVASVIAPLTPVSDERSVELTTRLHRHLAAGRPPAEALALASVVDGELDPTAVSFVCMGS